MYRLLDSVAECCPGHGPAHLLVESAAEIGFQWVSRQLGWERLGLPVLSNLADPIQHFRAAVLEAWRSKVSADLCFGKGFRGCPWLDFEGTLQLLDSDHVRERDEALLRGVLVGGFGVVSCWEGKGSACPSLCRVGSAVAMMLMVISSGTVHVLLVLLASVPITSWLVTFSLWGEWFSLGGESC